MVKVRLTRTGSKNAPSYRVVAVDSREKRDGKSLEILGHYNPSNNPPTFEYNQERLEYWRSVGAQLTNAVEKLIAGEYKYVKYEPKTAEEESSEKIATEAPTAESQPKAKETPSSEEEKTKAKKQPTKTKSGGTVSESKPVAEKVPPPAAEKSKVKKPPAEKEKA